MDVEARSSLSPSLDELRGVRKWVHVVMRVGSWINRGSFGEGVMVSQERERAIQRSCIRRCIYTGYTDVRPLFGQDGGLVDSEICERVRGVHRVCERSGMALNVLHALCPAGVSTHEIDGVSVKVRTCA